MKVKNEVWWKVNLKTGIEVQTRVSPILRYYIRNKTCEIIKQFQFLDHPEIQSYIEF